MIGRHQLDGCLWIHGRPGLGHRLPGNRHLAGQDERPRALARRCEASIHHELIKTMADHGGLVVRRSWFQVPRSCSRFGSSVGVRGFGVPELDVPVFDVPGLDVRGSGSMYSIS
jgi:hypothetical protein